MKCLRKKTPLSLRNTAAFTPLTDRFIQAEACSKEALAEALWRKIAEEKSRCLRCFALEKRVESELKILLAGLLWKACFSQEKMGNQSEVCLVEQLASLPWNRSFPLLRTLFALCHSLLQLPQLELGVSPLDCGAVPLSLGEYQPFCLIPYQPEHVQLGIFLLLLGLLKRDKPVLEMGLRLGLWQQKLLCFGSTPAWGVFARLGADTRLERCALYQLLQQGLRACHRGKMGTVFSLSEEAGELAPLWVLVEQAFLRVPVLDEFPFYPEKTKNWDPSCGLYSVQTEKTTSYLAMHGGKTGLGALHQKKVELVTYGPSYAPFLEKEGFGIEANGYAQQGLKKLFFQRESSKIGLKTCLRMVDQPSQDPGGIARFRGIWFEVRQEWQEPSVLVDMRILSLEGWNDVGMRFLVRADLVKEEQADTGYALSFQSGEEELRIDSLQPEGTWQLQRIGQPDLYWGANWQAVFCFTNAQAHYSWKIVCSGG